MAKPSKYAFVAVVVSVVVVGGTYAYIDYSLRHMQLDLSGLVGLVKDLDAVTDLARTVATVNQRCPFQIDQKSIGDKRQEAMMLYVATVVDLYKITFGKLPDRIADLDKLPSFDNASKLNGRRVEKSCSIYSRSTGSFALSCGGPMLPAKRVGTFFEKAGNVQRFYKLGGTEILYVPAPGCS